MMLMAQEIFAPIIGESRVRTFVHDKFAACRQVGATLLRAITAEPKIDPEQLDCYEEAANRPDHDPQGIRLEVGNEDYVVAMQTALQNRKNNNL